MPPGHDGTREEILAILRRRERVGVEELATDLGLAGATVRRHLDVLQRDNYVSVTQVRGHTGRPRHLFSLTEAGADLFPHHYVRLTQRLLGEIVGLEASETAGRSGADIASLVFEKMAERLAADYAPRVTGDTPEARVRSAVRLVADEGIDFEVVARGGDVRLLGRGCPCTRLAGEREASCDHDRRMLERILGVRVDTLAPADIPHDFRCGYLVTESPLAAPV
ncbi:MAG: winged helix-turn-helix transcriptional regulator [Chloroflexota bacterium]